MSSFGTTVPERLNPSIIRQQESQLGLSQSIRVAMPGIIKAFDAAKQTVSVQPAISEVVRVADGIATIPLNLLTDLPIMPYRAGNFVLTMPVQVGDECLVVFADFCIDAWFQSGGENNAQLEKRRHELSDGFAIVGCCSQPRVIANYSTDSAELRTLDGTVSIELQTDAINITAPGMQVNVSGTCNIHGDTVNVTADTLVNINGSSHTTIEGKDWLTHHHSGVTTGGGVTGPVV